MTRWAAAFFLIAAPAAAQVHKSPMAGRWYPADAPALNKLLDRSFAVAAKRTGDAAPRKMLLGLVVPHAGLDYSGAVAAAAYRLLGHPKNVILLGFSHQRPLQGVIAPELDAYATPLGTIRINRQVVKELRFTTLPEDRLCDHSVENQLPFLQRVAPKAGLVPLYVGDLSGEALALAAGKIARRIERGDVVIASSDFTHYGESYGYKPFPNDKDLPRRLFQRSMSSFEWIGSLDVSVFDRYLAATGDTLCGRGPIRLLMAALSRIKGEVYLSPQDYLASGELLRDYSTSVSYGALAFYPAAAFEVGKGDQTKLLQAARRTLDQYLASGKKERIPVPEPGRDQDLLQRTGLFVTLKKAGELRGCIGTMHSSEPLYEAVADRTLAAASEDARFPPVTAKDAPVSIEISLLTPLKRIQSWKEFHTGLGALLMMDGKTSVLLPQIAGEYGWTREQFLENLSRKAGLKPEAYRDARAGLYVYSAQVFGEEPAAKSSPANGTR